MLLASGTSATSVIGTVAGVIGLIAAYWLPTIMAFMRHVPVLMFLSRDAGYLAFLLAAPVSLKRI